MQKRALDVGRRTETNAYHLKQWIGFLQNKRTVLVRADRQSETRGLWSSFMPATAAAIVNKSGEDQAGIRREAGR